jgi:hypothetical protein
MLRNLVRGQPMWRHIRGMSAHGGANTTTRALVTNGWIIRDGQDYALTDEGRATLEAYDAKS